MRNRSNINERVIRMQSLQAGWIYFIIVIVSRTGKQLFDAHATSNVAPHSNSLFATPRGIHTMACIALDRINWSGRIFSWRCLKIDSMHMYALYADTIATLQCIWLGRRLGMGQVGWMWTWKKLVWMQTCLKKFQVGQMFCNNKCKRTL